MDIEAFFGVPFSHVGASKKPKPHRECKNCSCVSIYLSASCAWSSILTTDCHSKKAILVNDVSTLRRHIDAHHRAQYHQWALANNVESRLPSDILKRKEADANAKLAQQTLDAHLRTETPKERVYRYSEAIFRRAVIEWLICTDQPLSAVEHPKFKEMIKIAAAATQGVEIPSRKVARAEIMRLFNDQMKGLRDKLTVRPLAHFVDMCTC
ncbi:hypothetical protein C8Q80DRAFT_1111210 [Daedaleopsis nitida]|nr:hypothetical protein C8Q80DRAFT_1111210 [Daedaleopsis nitida]